MARKRTPTKFDDQQKAYQSDQTTRGTISAKKFDMQQFFELPSECLPKFLVDDENQSINRTDPTMVKTRIQTNKETLVDHWVDIF